MLNSAGKRTVEHALSEREPAAYLPLGLLLACIQHGFQNVLRVTCSGTVSGLAYLTAPSQGRCVHALGQMFTSMHTKSTATHRAL